LLFLRIKKGGGEGGGCTECVFLLFWMIILFFSLVEINMGCIVQVVKASLRLLQSTFLQGLASDYNRWALDAKYRDERSSS
jgi:hypothetical protein